jgi:hypothetical protein
MLDCQMRTDPRKMLSQIHQIDPTQRRIGEVVQSLDCHHPPAKQLPLLEVSMMSGTIVGIGAGHVRVLELRRVDVRRMHRAKTLMAPI